MTEQKSEQGCGWTNDPEYHCSLDCDTPVSQPSGEAPERVWFYRLHDGTWIPTWHRTAPTDVEYVRAPSPDSIAEKVRRVVDKFDELLKFTSKGYQSLSPDFAQSLADIIAAEFGGGVSHNDR
jgi:hypothetical protein